MIKVFLKKHFPDLVVIFLILLTSPLFFYKLGQSSLTSFDEAWYGGIAKDILSSGDILNLTWNGNSYYDHPPVGFWLIALSFKILGVSEFSARLPAAFLGIFSLFIINFLGKELFNKWVGFSAAVALSSSFWFLFRARSGNIDVILTFFFLLTLYLALKATKSKIHLLPFSLSLSCLLLTKTLVPFTIFPTLMLIFWKEKLHFKDFFDPALIIIVLTGGWFLNQIIHNTNFINLYLKIGLPGVEAKGSYLENLKLIKEYLHSGVGRWFWPGILSIILGPFLRQKRFLVLSVFFFSFFIPFIFSEKGHIWHLVPLHPIMILSFFGLSFVLLEKLIKKKIIIGLSLLGFSLCISFVQIRQMWYQFIDVPAYVSDEAILSKVVGKLEGEFFIDGDFLPAAYFYSGKKVDQVSGTLLRDIFETKPNFSLITYQWRLDEVGVTPNRYKILKKDRDKILVIKN